MISSDDEDEDEDKDKDKEDEDNEVTAVSDGDVVQTDFAEDFAEDFMASVHSLPFAGDLFDEIDHPFAQ